MDKVSAPCAMDWSIKLEKSLRSKNPVRAVETILETGKKLEQWIKEPEPAISVYNLFGLIPEEDKLFINTILLRLVDVFCSGDKLLKLAVVRVFMSMFKLSRGKNINERETCFLSKARVYNHLEILKRVKNVYDNGDTEVKSLALILFGCWRDFASEFAPIRYLIFTSMVSSHPLEVRSSLFAAACFCEVADDFALVVMEMLNDMVKFPELMPKTRLAAVRVFAKMGCSHAIANRAFKICMNLMLESSNDDNLVPFLVSLTVLASRSSHLASELARIIMQILGEDKTFHVRAAVLRCLHFLIKRGMCLSIVQESETEIFSSLLKQAELELDMQLKALQIFQEIIVYKLCAADESELHQLMAIVENASHLQIFSSSCLAIKILVDIWKQIVRTAEIRSIEVSSKSLPLQLVVLIMDRITILGKLCSDPFRVDYKLVGEVQDLFNVLLLIVGLHSEMKLLVLDKVSLFVEYIVNSIDGLRKIDEAQEMNFGVINYKGKRGAVVKSVLLVSINKFLIVFLENLDDDGSVLSQVYEKVKHIAEYVRSCSFFDWYTQMIFTLILHSPILWGSPVNEIGTNNDADGNSGVSLLTNIFDYGIVSLELSTQIVTENNYWPAYRAGVFAARLGAWVTSALIFDQLKTKVQSDINCVWLKSLTYLSHAEGKFQLLLMPSDSFKLVNWLRNSGYLPELSKNASGEFVHCVALHEAYMNLQSSLGMLGNIIASSEVFCFQTWFLVLKTRVLETVIDLVERLGLLNQDICNKMQVEEKNLTSCDSLQQLNRISLQLQKLAKEFDMLATCFIDIDDNSSSNIGTLSLSCSVLAFASGIVLFLPGFSFHETLVPFTSQSSECSRLVQDLARRLWKVDPEICEKLNMLVKVNESLNCYHLQPRNQVLRVCGKVKMLLSICRDALSCINGLQNLSNSMHDEEIMSEITKSCRNLLSQAIMKWMQIPFGVPKCFFNIRPCVGAELFALNSDSSKSIAEMSVEKGFQLSLDLCLQLKNIQQSRAPVRLTKLYCLLYTKLAYHTSTTKRNQKSYTPWKDEDLVEMSNKLFHHAIKPGKKQQVSGKSDWNKNGVSTIVQFEPNERGQGFSSCLLDVSRFPVGSYQIKWLSCCIDQHGFYWNLLPLNGKPVFTIKEAS